jgi:hypothetical protein
LLASGDLRQEYVEDLTYVWTSTLSEERAP